MFIEQTSHISEHHGWIEVICGSMFSGKTEELIRRLKRAELAMSDLLLFKPRVDTRYGAVQVVSHTGAALDAYSVETTEEILALSAGVKVIGIDEAQFFDASLVDVCSSIANKGARVIVAGLDMDFSGKPFGPIPDLMAIAEYVTKVHAICVTCGNLAHYSKREGDNQNQILIGAKEAYKPLCRVCYNSK